MPIPPTDPEAFTARLCDTLKRRRDVVIERHTLSYRKGSYPFLRIASRRIKRGDAVVIVTAGFHGDEIAGPLTILESIGRILDFAAERSVKIVIYPLINPSGFGAGTRYNIDDGTRSTGNNDFLRYELADGTMTDDLRSSVAFRRWYWSSSVRAAAGSPKAGLSRLQGLPKETRLMHRLLRKDLRLRPVAIVDLHQDNFMRKAAAYQYVFGDSSSYKGIVGRVARRVALLAGKRIDSGYEHGKWMRSDPYGCIVRHDGSITDLCHRLGVRHCVAVETTGATPVRTACAVNLLWILGIIGLAKKEVRAGR